MRTIAFLSVLAFFAQSVCAADAPPAFPLVGCWRVVGDDGRVHHGDNLSEDNFLPDGKLRFIFRPAGRPMSEGTVSDFSGYTFQPPSTFFIRWNMGEVFLTQRVEFHLDGEVVTLRWFPRSDEPSDTPVRSSKMRRVHPKKHPHPA